MKTWPSSNVSFVEGSEHVRKSAVPLSSHLLLPPSHSYKDSMLLVLQSSSRKLGHPEKGGRELACALLQR